MPKKRVVIAGMGFGGLRAARALAGSDVELIMIDRNNYHLFQPLLYQVATAGLEQEEIAYPLRGLVRRWHNASFLLAEICGVNFADKCVQTDAGPVQYDYLVVAAGSRTNFFGMESVVAHAFDLKRLDQAEDLRNHILLMFERASHEPDAKLRSALLTFVVVGGGPTGVEFSGALRELIVYVLSQDHPDIAVSDTRIILMEATDSLLTAMPDDLRRYAYDKLRSMGVEVMLESRVVGATAASVELYGGTEIASHTLLWSAGVSAAELAGYLRDVESGAGGRIMVQPDLTIHDHPEVFVVGDMACCTKDGVPLPMMAPVAIQQGEYAARAIMAREQGRSLPAFHYLDKGAMATIGKSSAVATAAGFKFRGFIAWVAWLLLHLYYLIGFRNRLIVMMNWTYAYWFQERQVRLITAIKRRAVSVVLDRNEP
ncbi:MAG: NAD(P)/FAD-dependent oxidoreductase [Desulfuromonadaceae bacterium]|nr:NAD(P)/FAD-dependent oxidoreductase [Desulfuromonadaceae bacterium]MDD5107677.1 NAD(P)/FAD-dependent oxidoreductase [Desulfuromonadaceae bacterium]